jgi:hypothetical protein
VSEADAARYLIEPSLLREVVQYVHNGHKVVLLMPKISSATAMPTCGGFVPCHNPRCEAIIDERHMYCSCMCAHMCAKMEGSGDSEEEEAMDMCIVIRDDIKRKHALVKRGGGGVSKRRRRVLITPRVLEDTRSRRKTSLPRASPCM